MAVKRPKGKMMKNNFSTKRRGRFIRTVAIILASVIVLLALNTVALIIVYNSFFVRCERPDYSAYPGLYCYERIEDTLSRENISFKSADADISAYYYEANDPKGLVVIAPGYVAGADDYLPLTEAFVNGGYSVFSLDYTGVYDSGGRNGIGMCQSLVDLDRALTFIGEDEEMSSLPLFLVGHSWGGYASASVLELHPEVDGCVLIAPMYNGATVMVEMGAMLYGDFLRLGQPVFDVYQSQLFGEYTEYNGVRGINSTDIPVLIAQGVDDDVMTMDGLSITAHKDEITNPNVTYYYGYGLQGGHTEIWHSVESCEYQKQIAERIDEIYESDDEQFIAKELSSLYSSVDHRLYSEVNPELLSLIFLMLDEVVENG